MDHRLQGRASSRATRDRDSSCFRFINVDDDAIKVDCDAVGPIGAPVRIDAPVDVGIEPGIAKAAVASQSDAPFGGGADPVDLAGLGREPCEGAVPRATEVRRRRGNPGPGP